MANVETLVGGTGNDTITYTTLVSKGSINLGDGTDTLTFGDFTNTATVSDVESIIGGSAARYHDVLARSRPRQIDLDDGNDTLTLGNFANTVTVVNVETIIGGTDADTITVSGSGAAMVRGGGGIDIVSGGSGADTFVFDKKVAGSYMVVQNMGTGADKIGLDTDNSSTLTTNAYDTTGALTNGGNITSVADNATLLPTIASTGGKGGFVYQQDTGELYFSANGNFTGGGTLVGVITTNGSTPWTYDFTKFIDV